MSVGEPSHPPGLGRGKGGGVEGTKRGGGGSAGRGRPGGGAGRGRFRQAGIPGPLPQASPFMVRRPGLRGGGSQGAGRAEGREARAPPGSARSGVGPEPAGARAAQVSGVGVGGVLALQALLWPHTSDSAGNPGPKPTPPPAGTPAPWRGLGNGLGMGAVLPSSVPPFLSPE